MHITDAMLRQMPRRCRLCGRVRPLQVPVELVIRSRQQQEGHDDVRCDGWRREGKGRGHTYNGLQGKGMFGRKSVL